VEIEGPEGSPYEHGVFKLAAQLSDRYPFEPPKVVFKTRIYHPNIDVNGRICSDALKLPPAGCWSPKMNLNTVFAAIRLLMGEPNPDDPLENEIAHEFKTSRQLYFQKAQSMTRQYAVKSVNSEESVCSKSEEVDGDTFPNPVQTEIAKSAEPLSTAGLPEAEKAALPLQSTNPAISEPIVVEISNARESELNIPQPLKIGKKRGGLSLSGAKSKKLK
ncbi:ubiquitin-conjugating enzyme/RWD-like protein, partial [Obelidium mucronatum]